MKNRFGYFFFFFLILVNWWHITGCANMIPPGGGPRDSIAPRLIKAIPQDSAVGFKGNKLQLYFDEFIELDNIQQEIILSPLTKTTPQVQRKLNVVTVSFNDTLEPNTTYSINFGNGIKDLNEGNKAHNFTYTFSTGNFIDSFSLQGQVIVAETGKTDTTLLVGLYSNLADSAVLKERPRYYVKLSGNGSFRFNHLPRRAIRVVALKDENGNKYYDGKSELFAFADTPVIPSLTPDPIQLFAYAEQKSDKNQQPAALLSKGGTGNDSKKSKPAPEPLKLSSANAAAGVLDLLQPLQLFFNNPLQKYVSDSMRLTDANNKPLQGVSIAIDSNRKTLSFSFNKEPQTAYQLILLKGCATDTLGSVWSKNDTLRFTTAKQSEYGSLRLNFVNLSTYKHPVLLIVSGDEITATYPISASGLIIPLFKPGSYEMRILEDDNQNGKWDPGNYIQKRQPEKVTVVKNKLNVKADWDTELTITL